VHDALFDVLQEKTHLQWIVVDFVLAGSVPPDE
jgi:hypothetical protein